VLTRRFVWNVRVGCRYQVDERFGFGFGAFTDHSEGSPIAELGRTRVDFYGVTAGAEVRTPHALGEREEGKTLIFSTTFAIRYAVGVGEVGGLRFDPAQGAEQDTRPVPTTIHEASLHVG